MAYNYLTGSNRNPKTGGTALDEEFPNPDDITTSLWATTYERKAANTNQLTVDQNTSGQSGVITISVPPETVYKYVEIKAYIRGIAYSGEDNVDNATTGRVKWRLFKTYNSTDTDLIAENTLAYEDSIYQDNFAPSMHQMNHIFPVYYYEPTQDERDNGFDIKIEITGSTGQGASFTGEVLYLYAMGI